MKNAAILAVAVLGLAVALPSCGNNKSLIDNELQEKHLCGGYTEQREPSEDEMTLFRQATAGIDTTFTPLSVATQVVAGLNYKFWCRFEDSVHGLSGHCWTVIYKDLQGNATLTGITVEE